LDPQQLGRRSDVQPAIGSQNAVADTGIGDNGTQQLPPRRKDTHTSWTHLRARRNIHVRHVHDRSPLVVSRAGQVYDQSQNACAPPTDSRPSQVRGRLCHLSQAPGVSVPQFRDKNRRGIGQSQSKWTAYTMETPAHLSTHNLRHPVHCSRQRAQEGSDS
jgi:hypothetical protein